MPCKIFCIVGAVAVTGIVILACFAREFGRYIDDVYPSDINDDEECGKDGEEVLR